jgi:hypothetical protein
MGSFMVLPEPFQKAQHSSLEGRKVLMHDVPDHRVGDDLVVVPQHIADARDLLPGNAGSASFSA